MKEIVYADLIEHVRKYSLADVGDVSALMEYQRFIESCKNKTYSAHEKLHLHHIIPKSIIKKWNILYENTDIVPINPNDQNNLIYLSLEDHITAHELYAKCYATTTLDYRINIWALLVLKRQKSFEDINNIKMCRSGKNNPFYGKTHTPEVLQKMAERTTQNLKNKTYLERYGSEERAKIEAEKRKTSLNDYWKNISSTQKQKHCDVMKRAAINRKKPSKYYNEIPITVLGIEYRSTADAMKSLGVSEHILKQIIKHGTPDYPGRHKLKNNKNKI